MDTETKKKKKFKLPHIFVLLTAIIIVCAVATWILPAGEFDRQVNEAGGLGDVYKRQLPHR